jgi:hypothetical protein
MSSRAIEEPASTHELQFKQMVDLAERPLFVAADMGDFEKVKNFCSEMDFMAEENRGIYTETVLHYVIIFGKLQVHDDIALWLATEGYKIQEEKFGQT